MEQDPEKMKKILLFAIVGVVVVAIILIVVLVVASSIADSKNNIIIDSVSSKINETLLSVDEAGEIYVSISQIAPMLAYDFYNGEYGKATEERTRCYVKNENELASFEMDSNVIYKLELGKTDNLYEKYVLGSTVKRINNGLYVNLQGLKRAFNVDVVYDANKNVLTINTLPYLYNQFNDAVKSLGYTSLAEQFANKKALLYGYLVVVKNRDNYGVISSTGETIIGTKYETIEFLEETNEFLASSDDKYGILTSNGDTKIDLAYNELKIIDSELGLYLDKAGEKYGILKKDGNVLIYSEYDYIGVKDVESFPNDEIKNPYILLGFVIPVTQKGKIGFYNVDGSVIMEPTRLSTLGCISVSDKTEASANVLIIPKSEGVEGIVVGVTGMNNDTTYGIYNPRTKKQLTPTTFTKINRKIVDGEEKYYMEFGSSVSTVRSRLTNQVQEIEGDETTVNINELISTPTNTTNGNTAGTNNLNQSTNTSSTVNELTTGISPIGASTSTQNSTQSGTIPSNTQSNTSTNSYQSSSSQINGFEVLSVNSPEPVLVQ